MLPRADSILESIEYAVQAESASCRIKMFARSQVFFENVRRFEVRKEMHR